MINAEGIKTIDITDEQLSSFYSDLTMNHFDSPINAYTVFRTNSNELVGPYLWDGAAYQQVKYQTFNSRMFGKIKPKPQDPYQVAYFDSIARNQLTFCTGIAGSGKSQIALAYAFQELEAERISKIVIFCNPYIAKDAIKFGFLPGTKTMKLLETSIGSTLISKIGSRDIVEQMIDREEIVLMPMGDCRGYEVPKDSFVYFSESQNLSKYLIKLFLQRLTDDCKAVVEGDTKQTDSHLFEKESNGLQAAIRVFLGEPYCGHVRLVNNYRGRISRKAEEIED